MNDVQYIAFRCSTLTWIPLQISQKHSSDLPPSAFYFFYSFLICQQVRRRCSGQTVKPQEELLFKGIKEAKRTVGPAAPPENCSFPLFILICWKFSLFASFYGVKKKRKTRTIPKLFMFSESLDPKTQYPVTAYIGEEKKKYKMTR